MRAATNQSKMIGTYGGCSMLDLEAIRMRERIPQTAEFITNCVDDIADLIIEVELLRHALAELIQAVSKGSDEDINITMCAAEDLIND